MENIESTGKFQEKIVLTPDEIRVIKDQLAGRFDRHLSSDKDKEILSAVIRKAERLFRELDEEFDDLIEWFWDKYQAQEN